MMVSTSCSCSWSSSHKYHFQKKRGGDFKSLGVGMIMMRTLVSQQKTVQRFQTIKDMVNLGEILRLSQNYASSSLRSTFLWSFNGLRYFHKSLGLFLKLFLSVIIIFATQGQDLMIFSLMIASQQFSSKKTVSKGVSSAVCFHCLWWDKTNSLG